MGRGNPRRRSGAAVIANLNRPQVPRSEHERQATAVQDRRAQDTVQPVVMAWGGGTRGNKVGCTPLQVASRDTVSRARVGRGHRGSLGRGAIRQTRSWRGARTGDKSRASVVTRAQATGRADGTRPSDC